MLTLQFLAALLGLIVGSFLNVVILRVPAGKSLSREPSHCPRCRHRLAPWELVPVLSYVFLRGRCSRCHRHISWQYPLVEATTAILFVLAISFSSTYGFAALAAFTSAICVVVFMIDLREQLILDRILLPALAVVALANILLGRSALDWLSGAILGSGFFFFQYVVSRGRWIGGGDIRMGMFMGAVLGLTSTAVALFLAYVCGALVAIVLLLMRRTHLGAALPFGTFLAAATIIALYWAQPLFTALFP